MTRIARAIALYCVTAGLNRLQLVQAGSERRELDRPGYTAEMRFSADLLFVSAAKIGASFFYR